MELLELAIKKYLSASTAISDDCSPPRAASWVYDFSAFIAMAERGGGRAEAVENNARAVKKRRGGGCDR